MRGDYQLLAAAHLLTALGFAALLSRQDPLRDTMLFVRHAQLTAAGLAVFCARLRDRLRRLARASFSYLPLAGALALSVALIVLGAGPTGSNAKVNLGPLQPVEFIRLLLALFLAGYFARRWELLRQVRGRRVRAFDVPRWLNVPRADYVLPVARRRRRRAAVLLSAEGSGTRALSLLRLPADVCDCAKPRRPRGRGIRTARLPASTSATR